jgi:hypothetical protein
MNEDAARNQIDMQHADACKRGQPLPHFVRNLRSSLDSLTDDPYSPGHIVEVKHDTHLLRFPGQHKKQTGRQKTEQEDSLQRS